MSGLPNEVRLEVYEAIIEYGTSGTHPSGLKQMAMLAFNFAKTTLDKDREKYEDTRKKRSEAGKKHKGNQYKNGTSVPFDEQMEQNGTNGTVYVDDSVYVNKLSDESVIKCVRAHEDTSSASTEYLNKFFNNGKQMIESLLMSLGLPPDASDTLKNMAEAIVNEWRMSEQTHKDYNDFCKHLISTIRIRVAKNKESGVAIEKQNKAAEQREKEHDDFMQRLDDMRRNSVSYADAKNSEEYMRAMMEA
jgi:hypothetical protein